MMRFRSRAALVTACLFPLLSACQTEGTGLGPDDEEPEPVPLATDNIMVRIQTIDVEHDCDPNTDNPGDFRGWIEVWQDANPAEDVADYALVGQSTKRSVTIHSGEIRGLGDAMRVDAAVVRAPGRPVSVRAFVHELDGSNVDEGTISQMHTLYWLSSQDCWADAVCMGPAGSGPYRRAWTHREEFRDDVFDLFNPDDEGCDFTVGYEAYID